MIEQRRLTKEEIEELIIEAPISETINLQQYLLSVEQHPYDFFNNHAIDHFGLLSNGRPIYMAALVPNDDGQQEFWTVVNTDVKETFSLCKYVKRELKRWVQKYGDVWATMTKVRPQNIKWTEWLGFKKYNETDDLVTLLLRG